VLSHCCCSDICYLLLRLSAFFRRVWHRCCYGSCFNHKTA